MSEYLFKIKVSLYFWTILLVVWIFLYSPPTHTISVQKINILPFDLVEIPSFPTQVAESNILVSAKYYASFDVSSGQFLMGKDFHHRHPPASTSKLMLVYLSLQKCSPDQEIEVKESLGEGAVLGLQPGERLKLRDLVYASLLPSANDAALALAEGCFGSVSSAVQAMNEQAKSWHLGDTNFSNPTGLDADGNYSSAWDLAAIATLVTQNSLIASAVSTPYFTIQSSLGTYNLVSTNKLLGINGVDGVKTGSTDLAGENLIVSDNLAGHRIITVVLGSSDRFRDTQVLLSEISRIYRWKVESDLNLGPVLSVSDSLK